ncbi:MULTISPECIES: polysaccharide biosynthesis protein [Clostridium]|uniref:Polysaccharide biosynthesis protein n=1 Tax=Clostridium faecium TaxID=2762223 RepID=A0ABR8YRD3_9CLOT|nr:MULTISPECIES: polysaccharide biosynthesis protein [Clostridium]MBD8046807.1 polysaccharide biosynthesis protein [Clostridium faecium]MDU1348687.1 polysaccharide biosynthesis protein [Clostridium argentinense]
MGNSSKLNAQSAAKGVAILSIAMLFVKLMSLLYVPALRAILKPEGIGVYYSCYQIFQYFYIIGNSGLPVAISKIVSEFIALGNYKDAVKTFKMARAMAFIVGLLLTLMLFIFAGPLAKSMNSEQSTYALMALSPTILITTILCAYKGYFQGRGNMTPTAISQIIEQVFNTAFSLIFAYLLIGYGNEYGAAGGTVGTTLGALVAAIYFFRFYKKNKANNIPLGYSHKGIERASNEEIARKILFYAIPITIGIAIQQAGTLVDLKLVKSRLDIAGFDKSNIEILWGILSQYTVLINVPLALVSSLSISIVPIISAHSATKDRKSLRNSVNTSVKASYLITVPSAVGLSVFSLQILQLLKLDLNISNLLFYGSYVIILMAIVYLQTSILQGLGKVKAVTVFSVIGLLGKIIANYVFVAVPQINILGAIIGNAISFLIMLILNQILINKSLKIKVSIIRPIVKPFIASGVMAIVGLLWYNLVYKVFLMLSRGYIANALSIITTIFVAVIVYFISLIYIGGIRKRDLQMIPKKILRFIPEKLLLKIRQ